MAKIGNRVAQVVLVMSVHLGLHGRREKRLELASSQSRSAGRPKHAAEPTKPRRGKVGERAEEAAPKGMLEWSPFAVGGAD